MAEGINNSIAIAQRHYVKILKRDEPRSLLAFIVAVFNCQQKELLSYFEKIPEVTLKSDEESKKIIDIIVTKEKKKFFSDINLFIKLVEKMFLKQEFLTIGVEANYIDREYRDSYYSHYSELHSETSRYCYRLMFFSGILKNELNAVLVKDNENRLQKNFIGSMVIRPIKNAAIGRTLLDSCFWLDSGYIRRTEYHLYYAGLRLTVNAFPFSMQDQVTTTCAETTILNILDYYSNQYTDYRFLLPSEISEIVRQNHYDRVVPTLGLSYQNISRLLYKTGFSPKSYFTKANANVEQIRRFLAYYVESGMPVAIGLIDRTNKSEDIGHSIVCIGHGKCNKEFVKDYNWKNNQTSFFLNSIYSHSEFIVQDDTRIPYHCLVNVEANVFKYGEDEHLLSLECLVAPLYKRMYMDAQRAEDTINELFISDKFRPNKDYNIGDSKENPLIYRLFLASSRHFKQARIKGVADEWLKQIYNEITLPQFIWVCELYSKKGYEEGMALGEIVLDATYSGRNLSQSCLMINYPNKHLAKNQQHESLFVVKKNNNETTNNQANKEYEEDNVGEYDWVRINRSEVNIYPAYECNLHKIEFPVK